MIKFFIRLLGLKGSFSWAVKQMKNGKILAVKRNIMLKNFRINPVSKALQCSYTPENIRWEDVYIFIFYFESTDWYIVKD